MQINKRFLFGNILARVQYKKSIYENFKTKSHCYFYLLKPSADTQPISVNKKKKSSFKKKRKTYTKKKLPVLFFPIFIFSNFSCRFNCIISLRKISRLVSIDICKSRQSLAGCTIFHVPNIVSIPPQILHTPVIFIVLNKEKRVKKKI